MQGNDKVALVDTVEPGLVKELLANLDELGIKKLDYVVCHHAEQDHSGSIPAVLARFPGAKVVTNQKCMDLLASHLRVPTSACDIITDGAVLDLGGRSLQFMFAPWVHWPETMLSFLREDKILFTCDFFGSHFATGTLYADDEHHVYLSAKRYYAEIMMPFRQKYPAYLQKIEAMAPENHRPQPRAHLPPTEIHSRRTRRARNICPRRPGEMQRASRRAARRRERVPPSRDRLSACRGRPGVAPHARWLRAALRVDGLAAAMRPRVTSPQGSVRSWLETIVPNGDQLIVPSAPAPSSRHRRALGALKTAHALAQRHRWPGENVVPHTRGGAVSYWVHMPGQGLEGDDDEVGGEPGAPDLGPNGPVFPSSTRGNTVSDPNGIRTR